MTDASPEGTGPESVEAAVRRLEDRLAGTRNQAARAMRDLHRRMSKDVRAAERRAERAERRLAESKVRVAQLRERARTAERRLAAATAAPATGAAPAGGARRLAGRVARKVGLRRP